MPHSAYAYLSFGGDFDRRELSEFIGLAPTEAWNKAERNREKELPKTALWRYATPEVSAEVLDVYEIGRGLIRDLIPYQDSIRDAALKWSLDPILQLVLGFSHAPSVPTPVLGFDREVIRFAAHIGASIDIDTYRRTDGN